MLNSAQKEKEKKRYEFVVKPDFNEHQINFSYMGQKLYFTLYS